MDILINAAIALTTSIVTALIAVKFSLKRFYEERWWDRKLEAYTSVFEALYKLKNYADVKYTYELEPFRKISAEEEARLQAQWRMARDEVDKAIEIGSFTISEDSILCLRNFRKRPRFDPNDSPIFELAEQESEFLTECIDELKNHAAIDLKQKRTGKMFLGRLLESLIECDKGGK